MTKEKLDFFALSILTTITGLFYFIDLIKSPDHFPNYYAIFLMSLVITINSSTKKLSNKFVFLLYFVFIFVNFVLMESTITLNGLIIIFIISLALTSLFYCGYRFQKKNPINPNSLRWLQNKFPNQSSWVLAISVSLALLILFFSVLFFFQIQFELIFYIIFIAIIIYEPVSSAYFYGN